MNELEPTPETDAAHKKFYGEHPGDPSPGESEYGLGESVAWDFARSLERRLRAALKGENQ